MLHFLKSNRKTQFVGLHPDFLGFSASLLCAIHCSALPFFLSLAPLAGLQFLENPLIEYGMIVLSFFIASYALIYGYYRHHRKPLALTIVLLGFLLIAIGHLLEIARYEILFTSFGALIVASAHIINWKNIRHPNQKYTDCLELKKSSE